MPLPRSRHFLLYKSDKLWGKNLVPIFPRQKVVGAKKNWYFHICCLWLKTWKRTGWQMAPLVELILWSWADGALSEALSPVVSWLNLYPGTNGFTDNCLCFHNQLCLRTKWPNNCQHMVIMPNLQRAAIPARINGKHVRSIFLQLDRKVSCVA